MKSMDQCLVVAGACLDLAQRTHARVIELSTDLSGLAALFLARAGQALESVLLLAPHGLAGDAMSVTRTIVELEIDFLYIAADPDKRIQLFRDHDDFKVFKLVEAWEAHMGGELSPARREELNARYTRALANKPSGDTHWNSWAGISIKKRAEAVGRNVSYAIVYADMCRASHSSYGTHTYAMSGDDSAHFGRGAPDVRPLALAIASYFALVGRVAYACELRDLLPEYVELASLVERL